MCFEDKIETIKNHQNEICAIINNGVIQQYPTIQRIYNQIDKTEGDKQKLFKIFCGFYGITRCLRTLNEQNLRKLLLQGPQNKNAVPPLKNIIEQISRNRFEFSFATKARHTVDNNSPIFDVHVSRFFNGIKVNGNNKEEKFQSAEDVYSQLAGFYKARGQNGLAELIHIFDAHFPNTGFSDVKKIDFMIWGWGKLTKKQRRKHKRS